jgi:hypothetical protein
VRRKLDVLRVRFAPWYYLVSNEDFQKIRVPRATLIQRRKGGQP